MPPARQTVREDGHGPAAGRWWFGIGTDGRAHDLVVRGGGAQIPHQRAGGPRSQCSSEVTLAERGRVARVEPPQLLRLAARRAAERRRRRRVGFVNGWVVDDDRDDSRIRWRRHVRFNDADAVRAGRVGEWHPYWLEWCC